MKKKFYYDENTGVIEVTPFYDEEKEKNLPYIELTYEEWERDLSTCSYGFKKAYRDGKIIEVADEEVQASEEYQKNIDEMTAQVIKFNSEIEKCISAIETYESDINSINAEMKNNELRVATLEEEIAKAEEVQGKRIREFHKTNGSLSYLSLLFSAEDFSDLIDRLNATTKIVSLDRELISKINDSISLLVTIYSKSLILSTKALVLPV